jgi:DNA-binding NarL/FixJ family response regulator
VRIFLIDPSEIFRLGLKALLAEQRDVIIVGESAQAAAAFEAVRAQNADLVIAAIDPPDRSAVLLASRLREVEPTPRVLALASTADEVAVRQALLGGVAGYVLKSQPPAEILGAMREVAAGGRVLPTQMRDEAPAGVSQQRQRLDAPVLDRLSTREREIFDLIIWGQTNKQVALRLGISVKTVETHRSHINGKLQVHSAAELVRLASLCGALVAGDGSKAAPAAPPEAREPSLPRLVAKTC